MAVCKTPELKRSSGKHTDRIWPDARSLTGFSMLSPDDLLWLMEFWQKTLALIHLASTEGVNSESAPSDSRAGHKTSVYDVRMRLHLALETLCRAAEQRGLNSATIRAADLVIRKRLPQAAKWCFSDDGAGCLYRAEDFLCIRFPAYARPTVDEQRDFEQGIRELSRLRTKLEGELRTTPALTDPGAHVLQIPDDLITQERACEILACSAKTVWRRIDDGTVLAYGPKGRRKVSRAEIEGKRPQMLDRKPRRRNRSSRTANSKGTQ